MAEDQLVYKLIPRTVGGGKRYGVYGDSVAYRAAVQLDGTLTVCKPPRLTTVLYSNNLVNQQKAGSLFLAN